MFPYDAQTLDTTRRVGKSSECVLWGGGGRHSSGFEILCGVCITRLPFFFLSVCFSPDRAQNAFERITFPVFYQKCAGLRVMKLAERMERMDEIAPKLLSSLWFTAVFARTYVFPLVTCTLMKVMGTTGAEYRRRYSRQPRVNIPQSSV